MTKGLIERLKSVLGWSGQESNSSESSIDADVSEEVEAMEKMDEEDASAEGWVSDDK